MMTKTIMLACAGGMSTSLLVTKMRKAAKKRNIDVYIFATASAAIPEEAQKHNPAIILLGPQISFQYDNIVNEVNIPVDVIDMKDYGMMNGEKVLSFALSKIN
ncbi:PTS sugar transporter subunit IIB [Companilactobacillus kimchii]|nr:PTS sugar transporter subunit IIB [Companilactobacillus kimchii]